MEFYTSIDIPTPERLLEGCFREAARADLVAGCIDSLRVFLPESFHTHMTAVSDEVRTSARLLRELLERPQAQAHRVPKIIPYLNVLLPCLCRSLRDMTNFYEDKTLSKEIRWRAMYNKMTEEANLPLPQRFTLYNHFLLLLVQLIARSARRRFRVPARPSTN